MEHSLNTEDPLLVPLAVDVTAPVEELATEKLPLVVELLCLVALPVTVVLLVNDFVTVDVNALKIKVGPGV